MDRLRMEALEHLEQRRLILERTADDRNDAEGTSPVGERLSALEAAELKEIDAALERIRSGSFGQCETCGQAIGRQRLRALPETRHCIGCAANASNASAHDLQHRSR
jgi:RNA polymerase-binding transcription factor DksA